MEKVEGIMLRFFRFSELLLLEDKALGEGDSTYHSYECSYTQEYFIIIGRTLVLS